MDNQESIRVKGFDDMSTTTSFKLRQNFKDAVKSTAIGTAIASVILSVIFVPLVAFIFCLLTGSFPHFIEACVVCAVIAIMLSLGTISSSASDAKYKLNLLLRKFGNSYTELAKAINGFCSKEIHRDSKIIFGQNGVVLRDPPQGCLIQYETLDLYKDIILVFEREIYSNEEISGNTLLAGLPVGPNIGWAAGKINLSSNNQILVGYAVFYWNKWGEQRAIAYERHHRESAHKAFTIFKTHCKNARFGDFDGFEEYIKENKEKL